MTVFRSSVRTIAKSGSTGLKGDVTLSQGSNVTLTQSGNDISIASATGGDVSSNTSTSVDSEIALFSSTGGKTIKRATTTGVLKASSGVIAAATAGTDYTTPSSTETVTNKSIDGASNTITNICNFWLTVPGTPTRVSDTQFTITDTSNTNKYDLMFKRGVLLKWDESGTFQTAMIISSSYASNTVTINIVGDTLTAGFTSMKYCIHTAMRETFIIPGTLPSSATTDITKTWYVMEDVYIISADLRLKTAGASTGSTVVDINDDGTTKFTTKPTITSTGTSDLDNVADNPSTAVAKDSAITIDVDSITATAPAEAYVELFYYPVYWRYRS